MAITSRDVGISILTGVLISLVSLVVTAAAKSGRKEPAKEVHDGQQS
jgi:hypothetical protein